MVKYKKGCETGLKHRTKNTLPMFIGISILFNETRVGSLPLFPGNVAMVQEMTDLYYLFMASQLQTWGYLCILQMWGASWTGWHNISIGKQADGSEWSLEIPDATTMCNRNGAF